MGEQTIINHPRLKVRQITGREGPHHDPYGYEELHIRTPNESIVVHMGLAVYAKLGSQRIDAKGQDYDKPWEWADRIINESIGFTRTQLERIARKAKSRCPEGGYHETETVRGYPGEYLEVCRKCSKVVSDYFCDSAIR